MESSSFRIFNVSYILCVECLLCVCEHACVDNEYQLYEFVKISNILYQRILAYILDYLQASIISHVEIRSMLTDISLF